MLAYGRVSRAAAVGGGREHVMPRKRVKCPLGWTLLAENIDDVERVKLDLETQRELGCVVGEHVFLEYPWAYVDRDIVARSAKSATSPLLVFRDKIEAYQADTFLLGYASDRLVSRDFVICLTEQARRVVAERNRNIARAISTRVEGKIRKTANARRSSIDVSESAETSKDTRGLFEIEIVLPGGALGAARELGDRDSDGCRDSYAQLVNASEEFRRIERRCVCRSVQTHLPPREAYVQTYRGYPKNAWTQYDEDAFDGEPAERSLDDGVESRTESERNDDERSKGRSDVHSAVSDEEPREKTPLDLFLEARSPETMDVVKYNAAVNLHVDDIQNLSRRGELRVRSIARITPAFRELLSFADFNLTASKMVADVSLHPVSTECAVISYVSGSTESLSLTNCTGSDRDLQSSVLVWKFEDPLLPWLQLQHCREICCVSFCPHDGNIVIGGCSAGQVIVWDLKRYLDDDERFSKSRGNPAMVPASIISDERCSHRVAVRRIEWMPANYETESTRKSRDFAEVQFLTASEDGAIAVWSLPSLSSSLRNERTDDNADAPFEPIYRFAIPGEESRRITLLSSCLSSVEVSRERDESQQETYEPSAKGTYRAKCLWIGCADALIKCVWDEQMADAETSNVAQCELWNRSYAHNGPVTDIQRSPHLRDVLLTIGGHVFAIWKDDYLDSPLFWRRTGCRYTACCWASEPGVFLLGNRRGELELWDIRNESNRPALSQIVSVAPVVRLIPMDRVVAGERVKTVGVGDESGFFREYRQLGTDRADETIERMDWFREYVSREAQRKKVFADWQNEFLANDPSVVAKISARCDAERRKEFEEARARLRREDEDRSKSRAEKRVRGASKSADVAWKLKEYQRTKAVLLKKKNLDPIDLEAKRLPLVVSSAERNAKLKKAQETVRRREACFSDALSVEFPERLESKSERSEIGEAATRLVRSVDEYLTEFDELRDEICRKFTKDSRST
ncbi:dynein axonemal intermediate chain 3 [Nomia melanderi]|uniref:dynein axonemal intermediate chain 3 n=1 Tax=Nomia melanderi TaxID=2448451 RepID=UPI003FCC6AFE